MEKVNVGNGGYVDVVVEVDNDVRDGRREDDVRVVVGVT